MSLTAHGVQRLLGWILTDAPVTRPANLYVGLIDGWSNTELTSTGYTRAPATFAIDTNTDKFSNVNELQFIDNRPPYPHGPPLYMLGLFDMASGGNLFWTSGMIVTTNSPGDTLIVPPGALTLGVV